VIGVSHPDATVAALLIIACARRRGMAGGVALGLACAIKQTAWFVAVPLLLLSWREGSRGRQRYGLAAVAAFAVLNVPFAVASIPVWIKAVLTPLTQPTFPIGVGPAAVLTGGAYSAVALAVFSTLMVVAIASGIIWCARAPRSWAAAGVIIASLGLWIGMRSLGYYIALLGLAAVATVAGSRQVDNADLVPSPATLSEGSAPGARGATA
jgi:phosphatidylinositol alpha-1,6-mannosyltransferase